MQKTVEKPINQQIEWPFKSRRSLTTIDEYACRHKLSRIAIEDFRKMGFIKTRKFKGKTFVIDAPIINFPESEEVTALKEGVNIIEPRMSDNSSGNLKNNISSVYIKNIFATIIAKWKIISVFSLISLAALLSVGTYSAQKYDIDSLSQANAGLMTALKSSTLQIQQTVDLQIELDNTKAKILQLQNQLTDSRSQLSSLQKQLDFANQRIDYFQQRNSNASKQFDNQKNNIINRLSDINTNP